LALQPANSRTVMIQKFFIAKIQILKNCENRYAC
jgi:hypothetical protein